MAKSAVDIAFRKGILSNNPTRAWQVDNHSLVCATIREREDNRAREPNSPTANLLYDVIKRCGLVVKN